VGASSSRYLARGPGTPLPGDDLLLALVPPNAYVPYERVYNELLAVREEELAEWTAATPDEWGWALLMARGVGVTIQIRSAIQRRVLLCLTVPSEAPPRHPPGVGAALRKEIAEFFGALRRKPQTQPHEPALSRAEREAAAILDAHRF
jgi:hypothetical protein